MSEDMKDERQWLEEERDALQERLDFISKVLESE